MRLPPASIVPSGPIEMRLGSVPLGTVTGGCTIAPLAVTSLPVPSTLEGAVAGERLGPVGEADAEEAVALDRDVERQVGALHRALREAAPGVDRRGARAGLGALGGRAARLGVDEVAEADAHLLVAGGARVGEIVGHGVESLLLRGHAGRCGIESFEHASLYSAAGRGS